MFNPLELFPVSRSGLLHTVYLLTNIYLLISNGKSVAVTALLLTSLLWNNVQLDTLGPYLGHFVAAKVATANSDCNTNESSLVIIIRDTRVGIDYHRRKNLLTNTRETMMTWFYPERDYAPAADSWRRDPLPVRRRWTGDPRWTGDMGGLRR